MNEMDLKSGQHPFLHYSVDGVLLVFREQTEKHPKSIFDVDMFRFFRKLHMRYGLVLSCYCFFKKGNFSLENCSRSYKNEFEENASWLRFGFHGYEEHVDYDEEDSTLSIRQYEETIFSLREIVGESCIDTVPRIHGFKASCNFWDLLKNNRLQPIKGLLSSDDERVSYSLPPDCDSKLKKSGLLKNEGLVYVRTSQRFDS